jgi:hypothetical protein
MNAQELLRRHRIEVSLDNGPGRLVEAVNVLLADFSTKWKV